MLFHVFFVNVFQCKLIVCQMSNTRCQPLSILLLPMTAVVVLAITRVFTNETLLLYLWTAAVVLAHIHYGVSVVRAHMQRTCLIPCCAKRLQLFQRQRCVCCCSSAFILITSTAAVPVTRSQLRLRRHLKSPQKQWLCSFRSKLIDVKPPNSKRSSFM